MTLPVGQLLLIDEDKGVFAHVLRTKMTLDMGRIYFLEFHDERYESHYKECMWEEDYVNRWYENYLKVKHYDCKK